MSALSHITDSTFYSQPVYANKDEVKTYLPYACAAPAIHLNSWEEWLKPLGYKLLQPTLKSLPGKTEARPSCFFDPETGLKVSLFQKDSEILITFGATNSSETEVPTNEKTAYICKNLLSAGYNLFWAKPLLFERALELIEILKENFPDQKLLLTGQSLGGGIASYVGLKLNLVTICFNSLGLGSWVKREVSSEQISLSSRKITQVTIDTDWLSDSCMIKWLNPIFPGRRVYVPTAYPENAMETHGYIVGSLLVYLGIDRCSKPSDLLV